MEQLDLIQPILVKFLQEKDQIEKQTSATGIVPKEICQLCKKAEGRRWLVPLDERELDEIRRFMEWVRENKVLSVKYRSSLYADSVTVQTTQPIPKKQPISVAEGRYNYAYVPWRFQKLVFSTQKKAKLKEIDSCPHFSPDEGILVKLVKERRNIFDSSRIEKVAVLYLCCSECKDEIGKRECDAVRKIGFTYQIWCNLDDLLLRKALDEAKITYEMGESGEHVFGESHISSFHEHNLFFVRQHGILIGNADETTVSKLNPKLVVVFGKKSDITELLKLNTNILIVSDEGEFYFYNATKPIEKSLDSIIDSIVEKLDHYADDIRGNEHARLIKAFERIGQELGYVPEREFSKKGIRLDEIWRDKEGNFRVAIEVETKGGWKKDLLSTSEVEPDLSIIVTYQKTDTVAKALAGFSLMKYLPHKIVYINMETKNAFLFAANSQEIYVGKT